MAGMTSGSTNLEFAYDSNGTRISQRDGAVITKYLNDNRNHTGYSQVIFEKKGGEKRTYIIGHDIIAQKDATHGVLYFGYDGHGSTRTLWSSSGVLTGSIMSYDAYGNAIGFIPNTALTTLLYCGERFDSKLGMLYLRARYYDPNTGRFNRLDPFFGVLSDPQSLHKYTYCHADPVNKIDPLGLMTLGNAMLTIAIGASVGAIFGIANSVYGVWTGQMTLGTAYRTMIGYTIAGAVIAFSLILFALALTAVLAASLTFVFIIGVLLGGSLCYILNEALEDKKSNPHDYQSFGDRFLSSLPYFPSFLPVNLIIFLCKDKIKSEANNRQIPAELIGSVLLFELYQYNIMDSLGDDIVFFGGEEHSIGISQLSIRNVRKWCKSSVSLSDAEIREKLYNWGTSIELLAEAMAYWKSLASNNPYFQVSPSNWGTLTQEFKENSVKVYATTKDHDIEALGGDSPASKHFGVHGLKSIQYYGLLEP